MKLRIETGFELVSQQWRQLVEQDRQATIFQTEEWNRLWWQEWGRVRGEELNRRGVAGKVELAIMVVSAGKEPVVVVPMLRVGEYGELLGGEEITDYLDMVVREGVEAGRLGRVLKKGWREMGLKQVRWINLREDGYGMRVFSGQTGGKKRTGEVAPYINLGQIDDWEGYLAGLERKQRHEVRRKLRRLDAAGAYTLCQAEEAVGELDDFFRLHRVSAREKSEFMTDKMEGFFRKVAREFNRHGWLEVCYLKLEGKKVAVVWCYVWRDKIMLYNSGYDPLVGYYAPGLMLKTLSIKRAIEAGRVEYDFMRGDERYKYDLGGQNRQLWELTINAGLS